MVKEESEDKISHDNIPVEGLTLTELKPKVREYIKQHMKLYAFVERARNKINILLGLWVRWNNLNLAEYLHI